MNIEDVIGVGPGERSTHELRRILEALNYLHQCRRRARSFAILTGESVRLVEHALERFFGELPLSVRVVRILAPTDSSHAFLEAILAQLGFEPFESTTDDLLRLLNVVLRQGASEHAGTVIVVEDAQDFGPHVFETIRELARNARDISPPPLVIMAGAPRLNRVLDSQGMLSVVKLTHPRFDFDSPAQTERADGNDGAGNGEHTARLLLSIGDEVVGEFPVSRDRMLIGRSHYCDACLASRYVSRQHAIVLRNRDGDWLIDLKSTNGTSVNSKMVQHHRLRHGDIITIGNYRLRYDNPAARAEAAPAKATRDQMSETVVMRSLQALRVARENAGKQSGSAPTAA